jgi:DNA invertase Pin-like site-specific DNA recombinase
MWPAPKERLVRCAIYTRKSTEQGLEAEVSSLETQRDVCRAYIRCQAHNNWSEVPQQYDDGGYSGAKLERPALQRLIADIKAGRIDIVLIYKIDRLTRSLTDFVRIIDVLNRYGASFVSVTQTFDTSDSMGRMVLNILLTFAQFERELMSERVRDKKAAMRRKGLYAGGLPPMGYLVKNGRLVVDCERAEWIREIFQLYLDMPPRRIAAALTARGCTTRRWITKNGKVHGGQPVTTATVEHILTNPIYAGYIVYRGEWIKTESEALIDREQWDQVQEIRKSRCLGITDPNKNFLLGILHDSQGRRMRTLSRAPGRARGYRYYRTQYAGWARKPHIRHVLVDANRVEALAKSILLDLLSDRKHLKKTVLSLGLYSDEIKRLLGNGQLAARRLQLMDPVQLRHAFLAMVPRAEVSRTELRLYVSCYDVSRFLAWDGIGLFDRDTLKPSQGADRVELIRAPAFLVCGHPYFALPIMPCKNPTAEPDKKLVELLELAAELRLFVLANRTRSIRELASEKSMGPSHFARLLRINYLAPDIQAAIVDGTQPPGLTSHKILYGALPLHWGQQRRLLGF